MPRWTHIIGALMLVLMLWTEAAACASESVEIIPVAAATIGHFDGDKDEVPSDQHKAVAHHHCACGQHQMAAITDVPRASVFYSSLQPLSGRNNVPAPAPEPDADLRPPIA